MDIPHWSAGYATIQYHFAPEIFVSEGQPGSIVADWVERTGGGLHHQAYQVKRMTIDSIVEEWKGKGIEFASEVLDCPDDKMRQVFTKPLDHLGGIIFELIERGEKGFCDSNVKKLMTSTKEI